jgi:predicted transcriptional regulator
MLTEAAVVSDKEFALQAIQRMPPQTSLQEISEELAILAAIRRGEAAADGGRVIPHDEIKRRSSAWTTK